QVEVEGHVSETVGENDMDCELLRPRRELLESQPVKRIDQRHVSSVLLHDGLLAQDHPHRVGSLDHGSSLHWTRGTLSSFSTPQLPWLGPMRQYEISSSLLLAPSLPFPLIVPKPT